MRLSRARVQNYRSIRDSDWFRVESSKTILVGPNEAGKTAVLRALEHIHHGPHAKPFEPLRDYPRSEYHVLQSGQLRAQDVYVVEAEFDLEDDDKAAIRAISPAFTEVRYWRATSLENKEQHGLLDAPPIPTLGSQKDALRRIAAHVDFRVPGRPRGNTVTLPSEQLNEIIGSWMDARPIGREEARRLGAWLDSSVAPHVDEANTLEINRLASLRETITLGSAHDGVLDELSKRLPVLLYFSTYARVTPLLHLGHLAAAIEDGGIDERDPYNFGNFCLLKLLNFSARQLSDLGRAEEPPPSNSEAFDRYRARLDERDATLNAASLRLTQQIKEVWQPAGEAGGAGGSGADYTIRIKADQQYLKVVVEDSLGVEVELDQRSEGFQWLVSFFIVFFAQAQDHDRDAILLLDEPGLSLHGLKQREFRSTLSRLAKSNQLLFTTHSPFLVGPDELDLVRVVELTDRRVGTKVHTELMAEDPASLLPLQEALGYDLAQTLFGHQRNLLLGSLTDYWYLEATAALLSESGEATFDQEIALVPAGGADKLVYFATILHSKDVRVAALLDSDPASDQSARQDTLIGALGNQGILRVRDLYSGSILRVQIEDLLRETLISVAKEALGWDVAVQASVQPSRSIVEVCAEALGPTFSRYQLAKTYVRWTRDHTAQDLTAAERTDWKAVVEGVNRALR